MQADATGTVVTTTVTGTTVKFALSGVAANVVNVSINEGATKIGDVPPASFPKTITAAIGTHAYTLTGWPTPPGGGGAKVFSITTTANVTGSVPAPPPPSTPTVSTSVSGTSVTFALSGVPTNVVNVSVAEGATKIGDYAPAAFPKTITAPAGTHNYALTGWPTAPGGGGARVFSLTTSATVSGSVPAPPPPVATVLPLKASADGRYLTDQNGAPYFILGDSAWGAIVNLSTANQDAYLQTRAAQGFNTVAAFVLQGMWNGGKTFDGVAPFTVGTGPANWDPTTPNPAYWARVDHFVSKARDLGLVVFLGVADLASWPYLGSNIWINNLRARGDGVTRAFGRWIGARYPTNLYPNVVWLDSSDDYSSYPTDDHILASLIGGVRDVTSQMHVEEISSESSLDNATIAPLVDMETVYTYTPPSFNTYRSWNRSGFKPVLFMEGHYEGENIGNWGYPTPKWVRQTFWSSTLSGALAGHVYGSKWYPFQTGWQGGISTAGSPGAAQVSLGRQLLTSISGWQTLVPDQSHTFVTGGYGTLDITPLAGYGVGSPAANLDNNDYASAAVSADAGLVYMPTSRTITVDFSRFGPNPTVQWFDPTTGVYSAVAGPFAASRSLTPPGRHADGSSDWVLVVKKG